MCLAQGPQRSDAGEALTRGPWASSQALYQWATVLLKQGIEKLIWYSVVSTAKYSSIMCPPAFIDLNLPRITHL